MSTQTPTMAPTLGTAAQLATVTKLDPAEIDTLWLLFGSVLVFFMQTGFAMLEVGSVGQKNTSNILLKNVLDASIGAIVWWFVGYGLNGGETLVSFMGGSKFATINDEFADDGGYNPASGATGFGSSGYLWAGWLFQWAFSAATATIVSGAVAERCSFGAYLVYTCCLTGFIYPVVAHGGWNIAGWASAWREDDLLFGCGVIDFAGSGVVHMTGGVAAFTAAAILGPRKPATKAAAGDAAGKYAPVFRTLGVLILWTGWYGFNAVSTLYIVGKGLVAAKTMVTTTLAAGAGAVSTLIFAYILKPGPDGKRVISLDYANNGVLAGLVAITSPCSTCDAYGAVIIGILAGPVFLAGDALLTVLGIDDVVLASPVHGFCGMFGVLMAAVFATEDNYSNAYYSARAADCAGILYGGNGASLGAACVFILFIIAWTGGLSALLFGGMSYMGMLKVSDDVEDKGMDVSEHGAAPAAPAGKTVEMTVVEVGEQQGTI